MAKHPAEIIATQIGFDLSEMKDHTYQPGAYRCALYTIGDYYFAAPATRARLPRDWQWHKIGTQFGRDIYRAHMTEDLI